MSSFSYVYNTYSTLIKKNKNFSSYIRKFRREQLTIPICLTASSYMTKYLRISLYIRKPFLIYDFTTAPYEFPYIWGKLYFLFYQCIWHEILTSGFYHDSVSLRALLRNLSKIRGDICNCVFITCVKALAKLIREKNLKLKSRVRLHLKVFYCLMKKTGV